MDYMHSDPSYWAATFQQVRTAYAGRPTETTVNVHAHVDGVGRAIGEVHLTAEHGVREGDYGALEDAFCEEFRRKVWEIFHPDEAAAREGEARARQATLAEMWKQQGANEASRALAGMSLSKRVSYEEAEMRLQAEAAKGLLRQENGKLKVLPPGVSNLLYPHQFSLPPQDTLLPPRYFGQSPTERAMEIASSPPVEYAMHPSLPN